MNDVGRHLVLLGNAPKSVSGKQESFSNRSARSTNETSDLSQSVGADQANHMPAFAQWLQQIEADDVTTSKKLSLIERSTSTNDLQSLDEEIDVAEIEQLIETVLSLNPHLVSEYLDTHELTSLIMPVLMQKLEGEPQDPLENLVPSLNQKPSNNSMDQPNKNQQVAQAQWAHLHVFPGYFAQPAMVSNEASINNDINLVQEIESEVEQLLKAERISKKLMNQAMTPEKLEAYQSISRQVESFLRGEGNVTLSTIIDEVRQVVKPEKPTYDIPNKELETTAELEKLLQQLKPLDKQTSPISQSIVKPGFDQPDLNGTGHLMSNQVNPATVVRQKDEVHQKTTGQIQSDVRGQVGKEEQSNSLLQSIPSPKQYGVKENTTSMESALLATKGNSQSNADQPMPVVERSLSAIQPSEMRAAQPLVEQESLHRSEEQRFVKQLQRIFQQGTMTQLKDGQVQFTLKLFPEHLGKLQIQFIQTGQKLTAQILADSSTTKELVERSLPQLRQSLVQQSISIEQIDVEDTNPHNQQDQKDQQSEQDRTNQDETEEPGNTSSFSFKTLLEDLFQTRNVGESNDIDHE